jgi:hypothetical protein
VAFFVSICILLRILIHSSKKLNLGLYLDYYSNSVLNFAAIVCSSTILFNNSDEGEGESEGLGEQPRENSEEPAEPSEEPIQHPGMPQEEPDYPDYDTDNDLDEGIGRLEPGKNDLNEVRRAIAGDNEARLNLEEKYPTFFERGNTIGNLRDLEDYILEEAEADPASSSSSESDNERENEENEEQGPSTALNPSTKRSRSESISEEEEGNSRKKIKTNKDDDDSNNKGGGNIGGSNDSAGPSGPSSNNEGSSNVRSKLSEILLGLGGIVEQLAEI